MSTPHSSPEGQPPDAAPSQGQISGVEALQEAQKGSPTHAGNASSTPTAGSTLAPTDSASQSIAAAPSSADHTSVSATASAVPFSSSSETHSRPQSQSHSQPQSHSRPQSHPPPQPQSQPQSPTHPLPPHPDQSPPLSELEAASQTAEARAALLASLSNIGSAATVPLEQRAADIQANNASLAGQDAAVRAATADLAKVGNEYAKLADEARGKLKELGDVQNWAEVLERDLLVLEETMRIVDEGEDHWADEERDREGGVDGGEGEGRKKGKERSGSGRWGAWFGGRGE